MFSSCQMKDAVTPTRPVASSTGRHQPPQVFRVMQIRSLPESVTKARGPPAPKLLSKTAGCTAGKIVGAPRLAGPQGHRSVSGEFALSRGAAVRRSPALMRELRAAAEWRSNKLTSSEYDETTWSARTWLTFVAQRLSVAVQLSVAQEAAEALGLSVAADPRAR